MKKLLMLVLCGLTASVSTLTADEAREIAGCGSSSCSKPCGCQQACGCRKEKKSCSKPKCGKPKKESPCKTKGTECSFENSLSESSRSQFHRFSPEQRARAMRYAKENNMTPDAAVDRVATGN